MGDSDLDDLGDVMVINGIEDLFAVLAELDDPAGPKHPELMGYGGLGKSDNVAEVADAKLAGDERRNDLQAAGIGKGFEELAGIKESVVIGHGQLCAVDGGFVMMVFLAGGFRDLLGIVCHR